MSIVDPPTKTKRRRRTPEQARLEILAAAERRLSEHGLDGLNVADVAHTAGMRHTTVLHHFGSTAAMRRALVAYMTDRLLSDVVAVLQQQPDAESPEILPRLFATLSSGGHIKLLAWLSVGGAEIDDEGPVSTDVAARFAELAALLAGRLQGAADPASAARRMILLIAAAAVGYGLTRDTLPALVGLDAAEAEAFPAWLGRQVEYLLARSGPVAGD
jgi:TetR/AcrR family transcriptional regulator, repressor for neighboring sulfatase